MEIKAAINHNSLQTVEESRGNKDRLNHLVSFKRSQPWLTADGGTETVRGLISQKLSK